jgi:hypothetical protein
VFTDFTSSADERTLDGRVSPGPFSVHFIRVAVTKFASCCIVFIPKAASTNTRPSILFKNKLYNNNNRNNKQTKNNKNEFQHDAEGNATGTDEW